MSTPTVTGSYHGYKQPSLDALALGRHFLKIADLTCQYRDPAWDRLNGCNRAGRGELDRAKPRHGRDHLQAPGLDLVPIAAWRQQRDPEPGRRKSGRHVQALAGVDASAAGIAGAEPLLDRAVVIGLTRQRDHRPTL